MLKKTIKYEDWDGNERTEDFYFNLTKAEALEFELSAKGGISKMVDEVVKAQDAAKIIEIFKSLIGKAYGEKSADGRRFCKSPEILSNFMETPAYSILFMELGTDADAAAAFVNGIIPKDNPPPK